MIELIVSVLLMTVFTGAAMVAIMSSSATSTDNRARVTASGLAVRELDFAAQMVAASETGVSDLILAGQVANPHLDPELTSISTGQYPFSLDGEDYRVVRTAQPYYSGTDSPCASADPSLGTRAGVLVTVTVSWASQGEDSTPHVASKLFAPNRNSGSGLGNDAALLAVTVTGADSSAGRPGVTVQVTGDGYQPPPSVTDSKGCALIPVKPNSAGSSYTVTIDPGKYVNKAGGIAQPSQVVSMVVPQSWRQVAFTDFEPAASLRVKIKGMNEAVHVVSLSGSGGILGDHEVDFVIEPEGADEIVITRLYPGSYGVRAYTSPSVSVSLEPGVEGYVELEIPT
jgi:hypothetical protein